MVSDHITGLISVCSLPTSVQIPRGKANRLREMDSAARHGAGTSARCRHSRTHLHRLTEDEQGQQDATLPSVIQ